MFALGTVTSERVYIPEEDQFFGNKRWIFKRVMSIDFIVTTTIQEYPTKTKGNIGSFKLANAGFRIYNTDPI